MEVNYNLYTDDGSELNLTKQPQNMCYAYKSELWSVH